MERLGSLLPRIASPVPGPVAEAWVEQLAKSECPALTLRRARRAEMSGASHDPIVWSQASGANVQDVDGNVYVDLSAGFGAASVGHAHPRVVQAIQEQSSRLVHALGDLQPADTKIRLLSRLTGLFPEPCRAILGLSGSDAVEAALKTAVLHTRRSGVLAFTGGYHGLSYAPLSVCGFSAEFREPFAAQLNPHVGFVAYPESAETLERTLAAVRTALATQQFGAVLVEPILGRGGVQVPPREFLPKLVSLCHAHGAVLVVDEVMTGFGRTGRMFAFEHEDVTPDLLCVGKALGGGMPVSACLGRTEIMAAWAGNAGPALHTGTFFGHPVSCAAALATLDVLQEERLDERARALGAQLFDALSWLQERPYVRALRGRGLLVGIELDSSKHSLACMRALLERGYITVPAGADARVISLTPPLCISAEQLSGFVSALSESLEVSV